eukprot:CAMPEP_0194281164 /NCGR_PEP_ID=MMETSP0169-20130528/20111_1 /TAXON_ID=218684 /ORGANISM="Corethron pennatum, Strain L29A3" /LENGTH=78 /DNA_ID=CAMNT_0039026151 /DNA_START=297 /DNA_END=530 /DNA_ORIENTATION=-
MSGAAPKYHPATVSPDRAEYEVERIRVSIPDAHVFRLPPRTSSAAWRGADWTEKIWQGTLRVVERGNRTLVLLVDERR